MVKLAYILLMAITFGCQAHLERNYHNRADYCGGTIFSLDTINNEFKMTSCDMYGEHETGGIYIQHKRELYLEETAIYERIEISDYNTIIIEIYVEGELVGDSLLCMFHDDEFWTDTNSRIELYNVQDNELIFMTIPLYKTFVCPARKGSLYKVYTEMALLEKSHLHYRIRKNRLISKDRSLIWLSDSTDI
jgi:hypothetical protein